MFLMAPMTAQQDASFLVHSNNTIMLWWHIILNVCTTTLNIQPELRHTYEAPTKFGLLFVANRNALGLQVAQNLVFVQQNDEIAQASRTRARGAFEDAHAMVG